jgi:benzoylformate decarboxylase
MKLTGSQATIEIFRQEGVKYVFGLPGATEVFFMEALEKCPEIQYILGLHEVVAAGMAEGYARTARRPAVLNLHTGTGLSAALPLLSNSFTGRVPLVITAGQQDARLKAYEPHLTADLVSLVKQFSKWATEINHAEDIITIFRRAFKFATQPPSGPVFVSLPQNIMQAEIDFHYVKNERISRPVPDKETIEYAAELIAGAKNPVIILQDGVAEYDALAETVTLAELIGARVYQPWMGDVNFPCNHPLYLGDLNISSTRTREILQDVDILIGIGVQLFSQAMYMTEPLLNPTTRIIQIDDNPWEIGKNLPVSVGINGDIKIAVASLVSSLREKMTQESIKLATARRLEIAALKSKEDQLFTEKANAEMNSYPISPYRLMRAIRDNLRPGTLIVDDCWSISAILRRTLAFSEPGSYQRSRNGGSIGWGLPGSLGVKLAAPEHPVVCVSGDGSALWSIQSLWTAAHYQIPVTFIICANQAYQQVRLTRKLFFSNAEEKKYLGTDLSDPAVDFCQLAEGFGLTAQRVERPEQIDKILKTAFHLDKPNLVEVKLA